MDKVLTLKLNADWVVLSACNTATGEDSDSGTVFDLGRAFFFAGAKALLVSNWPVNSVAARQLMTALFKRQQTGARSWPNSRPCVRPCCSSLTTTTISDCKAMKYSYAYSLFRAPFVVGN